MKRISLLARMTSMPQPKLLNHMSYVVTMIYIHHRSHRLRISFVPIDCSANHHDCWKSIVHILVHARLSFSIPGALVKELLMYEKSHISNEKTIRQLLLLSFTCLDKKKCIHHPTTKCICVLHTHREKTNIFDTLAHTNSKVNWFRYCLLR
jgi:hypothetical protein